MATNTTPSNLPFADMPESAAKPAAEPRMSTVPEESPQPEEGEAAPNPTEAPAPVMPKKEEKRAKLPEIVPGIDPLPDLPSIEDLERRSVIKRILLVVFSVIVLAAIGTGLVALVNTFFVQEHVIEPPTPPAEPTAIPANQDTDGDKMPDVWEIRYGFDPKDPSDARKDADVDRLRNVDEFHLKTDPLNEDTDGDGFTDGREVENGYNPNGEGRLTGVNGAGTAPENGQQGQTPATGTTESPASPTSLVAGRWSGSLIGKTLSTQQAFFTFQANGTVTGAFNVKKDAAVVSVDASGTFTFDAATNAVSATIKGTLLEGRTSEPFTGTLEGKMTADKTSMTGTWTIVPEKGTILKQDRGTFGFKKIGG